MCAGPQHDQRQGLPGGLVLVPRPSTHRVLQTDIQDCHSHHLEVQVPSYILTSSLLWTVYILLQVLSYQVEDKKIFQEGGE